MAKTTTRTTRKTRRSRRVSLVGGPPTVNETLQDRAIRHAIYLERLKAGEVRRIAAFLDETVLPRLIAEIQKRVRSIASKGFDTGPGTTKRLELLRSAIDDILRGARVRLSGDLRASLTSVAKTELEFQVARLQEATSVVGVDLVSPSPKFIRSVISKNPMQGRILKDWWRGIESHARTQTMAEIRSGLVLGESIPSLTARVSNVIDGTRRQVESIVRTSVNHVTTAAREETYRQNDHVIKSVVFVATLDARTTAICLGLDGKEFPVGEGPRPPMHFGCRSTTAPVTKSFRELGIKAKELSIETRQSMDGKVPADLTAAEWFDRQTRARQDEILGRERAELIRSGKVTLDRLVDKRHNPLTLAEIRAREGL